VVFGVNTVNIKVVTVTSINPINDNHLAPNLSNKRPVIGFISPIIIAPGNNANPDSTGENPNISCISSGRITAPPIIARNTVIPRAVVNVKILSLKIRNSNIGCFNFNCLKINHSNVNAPINIVRMTSALDHPFAPATLNPYNNPPNPTVDKIID